MTILSGDTLGICDYLFRGHTGSIRPPCQGENFLTILSMDKLGTWPWCQGHWEYVTIFSGITGNVCPSCGDTKGIYDYLGRGNTGNICQGTNYDYITIFQGTLGICYDIFRGHTGNIRPSCQRTNCMLIWSQDKLGAGLSCQGKHWDYATIYCQGTLGICDYIV